MKNSFHDRKEAGQVLARKLQHYARMQDLMVLGLPRGGVPVAFEVARELGAAIDVFIVRKLGVPGHEEYAMGAIASGGARVLNREVVMQLRDFDAILAEVTAKETAELERREAAYRGSRPRPSLHHKTVILVDDGLATGASMRAAVMALRVLRPGRIIVAVPVGSADACEAVAEEVDELVCVLKPARFLAVGEFYVDFSQTTDDEVCDLLTASEAWLPATA